MEIEKNPKMRPVAKSLLRFMDKIKGRPFSKMARVKEISNYSCGPATLEMLFSFVGFKVSQRGLIRSIRAQKRIKVYGIFIKDMAKAVEIVGKKNLVFWRKQKAAISDLDMAVNKYKWPVGVEWLGDFYENEDEDWGHYSVVTGVDKKSGYLRMADPYFNNYFGYGDLDRRYKISRFVRKWWDANEIKVAGTSKRRTVKDVRVMFVIAPRADRWPEKVGMIRYK